jgi:NAD(P)-dependent dehydrogenase (short-subunit alcohol dehydrogenase family)
MNNTIFITGASTGLGKATAKLFASKGWNVIATMRNIENGKELSEFENITILKLDVTNLNEIKSTVADAIKKHNIDVVFNNAGYGIKGPLEGITDEQLVLQINTNLLGVIRVTKEFTSYFREKRKGLFITTTSIGGLITVPLNSAYHATKWALEGWSESMTFELNQFGIDIKTVSPGFINTDFSKRSLVLAHHEAYSEIEEKVSKVMTDPSRANASTAEQIALVVYEAATDDKKQLRYLAGNDAKSIYAQRLAAGDEVFRNGINQLFLGT